MPAKEVTNGWRPRSTGCSSSRGNDPAEFEYREEKEAQALQPV
jgi:hypothetical protein